MNDHYPPGAYSEILRMERRAQNREQLFCENKLINKLYYLDLAKNNERDNKGHLICYHIIDEINEEHEALQSCIRDVMKSIADGKRVHDFNSFEVLVYQCFIRFIEREAEITTDTEFTEL